MLGRPEATAGKASPSSQATREQKFPEANGIAAYHALTGSGTVRSLIILAAAVSSLACATSRRAPADATPPTVKPTSRQELARMVREAKQEIDSAITRSDLPALAAVLHDSAMLITPTGDTLTGIVPFTTWLARDSALQVGFVGLKPRRSEYCTDGVLEWGGEATVLYTRSGVLEAAHQPYTLRWTVEPDGSLRATRLTLGSPARRPIRVGDCPSRSWVARRSAHVTLFASPPYGGTDRSTLRGDFTSQLHRNGYGSGNLARPGQVLPGYTGTLSEGTNLGFIGVRVRVRGPISVEGVQRIGRSENVIQGYDPSTFSHISLEHRDSYTAALASYRWRFVRLGAGPVRIASRWRQQESPLEYVSSAWNSRGPVVAEEWKSTDWGLMTQGSLAIPIAGPVGIEAFFQHRGFATADIPATSQNGPLKMSVGGVGFGAMLSLGF